MNPKDEDHQVECEDQQTSKGVYKAALFFNMLNKLTVTLHIVLFYVLAQTFLLVKVVVHIHLNVFCVLCRVKANEQKR